MAGKIRFSIFASLLLVQVALVCGQFGGLVQQMSSIPAGYANLGVQNQLQGLQLTNGQQLSLAGHSNLGNGVNSGLSGQSLPCQSPAGYSNLGNGVNSGQSIPCQSLAGYSNFGNGVNSGLSGQSLPCQSLEALSVASGSQYGPGSISVVADNLEIGGQVSVSGSMPFYGAVSVSGSVPTAGQGLVQYSSAPGVGISSGGCGCGLGSAGPGNAGLGGAGNGLSSLGGYGASVGSIGGVGLGSGGGCACNLY